MAEAQRESVLADEEDEHEAAAELEQQTSITAGGDQFAGETDLEIMDAAEWTANEDSATSQIQNTDPDVADNSDVQAAPHDEAQRVQSSAESELGRTQKREE
ncbi:hypothetical protein KCU67_g16970, partial [Aureobasidium melanogenum]